MQKEITPTVAVFTFPYLSLKTLESIYERRARKIKKKAPRTTVPGFIIVKKYGVAIDCLRNLFL